MRFKNFEFGAESLSELSFLDLTLISEQRTITLEKIVRRTDTETKQNIGEIIDVHPVTLSSLIWITWRAVYKGK